MLVSNQRPLSCEGSAIGCWRFLVLANACKQRHLVDYAFLNLQVICSGCCTVTAQAPKVAASALRSSHSEVASLLKTLRACRPVGHHGRVNPLLEPISCRRGQTGPGTEVERSGG
jgi:hypothetical protein